MRDLHSLVSQIKIPHLCRTHTATIRPYNDRTNFTASCSIVDVVRLAACLVRLAFSDSSLMKSASTQYGTMFQQQTKTNYRNERIRNCGNGSECTELPEENRDVVTFL